MRNVLKKISGASRKLLGTGNVGPFQDRISNPDEASKVVYDALMSDAPCMIARYGATELMTMVNYLGVKRGRPNLLKYVLGMELDWWWRDTTFSQIQNWSGFFPPTQNNVEKFCELMIEDSKLLDILVSWLDDEVYFRNVISAKHKIRGLFIDPFWTEKPWTKALEGKKVLVVHPFADLIFSQYYENGSRLFTNKDVLPEFELKAIKAVQSLGGSAVGFSDWFEALSYMQKEIDKMDYDICLIGCGAYGFPLAAHVKRMGKKAVHMGGSLQLLFGIKGKRWEDPNYGACELGKTGCYPALMNEYWVRPADKDKSKNANQVENGCYW